MAPKSTHWTTDKEYRLIHEVRERNILWDVSLVEYRRNDLKEVHWDEIAKILGPGYTSEIVKKRFINMKDTFMENNRRVRESANRCSGKSPDEIYVPRWPLFNSLKFLQKTVAQRQSSSNVEVPVSSQAYDASIFNRNQVYYDDNSEEAVKQRNEEAMSCYTAALNETPPNMHRIQKCLQKLLRALHKDRHHTIAHYKHLLDSSLDQAQREKPSTLEHLAEINRIANQSILMLERTFKTSLPDKKNVYPDLPTKVITLESQFDDNELLSDSYARLLTHEVSKLEQNVKSTCFLYPELSAKIGQLMDNYVLALRSKDETPGLLLAMPPEAEAAILDKYQDDVSNKQQEKEHQKQLERERKEQRKVERGELRTEQEQHEEREPVVEKKKIPQQTEQQPARVAAIHSEALVRASHSMTHDVSHSEPSYSVRREIYHRESKSAYFTLAFAGIALMAATIVGVAVFKRRSARSPHSQGFIEVDQAATPEERHVANMQINGYENPTYKYFEVKE